MEIMPLDKDTTLCISIAEKPSNFGTTIHNSAFQALKLNFIYKAFKIEKEGLAEAIRGIKVFGIRGCGVSMPHKTRVMQYLDSIDEHAKKIGAVNTIVNDAGRLIGYNTDYYGAKMALQNSYASAGKTALIIGTGGVARAIILALKDLGANINLTSRDKDKAKELTREFNVGFYGGNLEDISGDILVNATPVGMDGEGTIVEERVLEKFKAVLDVVVLKETPLIRKAKEKGLITIPGYKMSLYQALKQFELYTGKEAPVKVMEQSLRSLLI